MLKSFSQIWMLSLKVFKTINKNKDWDSIVLYFIFNNVYLIYKMYLKGVQF